MSKSLGYHEVPGEEPAEEFVSIFVVRHPQGISSEGALHQRNEGDKALRAAGLEVVAAMTGLGDAARAGVGAIMGGWEAG